MKRFSQQFNKKAQDIHLSVAEKRELKERVVSYMEYHPLPASLKTSSENVSVAGQNFILFNFNKWRVLRWSGVMAMVFVVSVSYFAEKAVPGDTLYAVKVGFNEEVRGTLARGSYEKVVWETELLNRRIAEARLLADEGKLTEEVEASVVSAVKVHSDNARKEIENLKLSDKDEATLASIGLNTALDIQTTSLMHRSETEVAGKSINKIAAILSATQAAEPVTADIDLPAYSRLLAKVESETTRAYELVKGIEDSATSDEKSTVTNRLGDIDTRISEAMALSEVDELAAKKDLVVALQQIHRLIAFMTNIDVRTNLTIDDLVPDTLTKEQRLALIKQQITTTEATLESVLADINATTTSSSTAEIKVSADQKEKVELAISETEEKLALLPALLEAADQDIDTLEKVSNEAYSIISDVAAMLKIAKPTEPQIKDTEPKVEEKSTSTDPTEEKDEEDKEEEEVLEV